MGVNNRLDLAGVNIFAASDDHVLQSIQNVEISRGILIADIACAEQAVSECWCSFFWTVPITAHDIRPPRNQFAVTPGFDLLSCLVYNLHIDSRTWSSARQEPIVSVLLVLQAREKT